MTKLEYIRANSIHDAIQLLSDPAWKSRPLAGGTDLLVQLRLETPTYNRFVDVSRTPEMKVIEIKDNIVHLGAAVTFSEIIANTLLSQIVPFFVEACQSVGSPQIRNAGTIGGNVANAAACADSLPSLVCLDAVVHLKSFKGERQMLVSEFVTGPHQTCLEEGELITHFTFHIPPSHTKNHFIKIGRRNAQSISRLSIAVIGGLDENGLINYLRLCPGAATPKTVRFYDVENFLLGKKPEESLFVEAGERTAQTMIAVTGMRWSTRYKEVALRAITERALRAVFSGDSSRKHTEVEQ
ncbi:MAG: FAD binding domain-containing protein [Anaerolineales bacterium]